MQSVIDAACVMYYNFFLVVQKLLFGMLSVQDSLLSTVSMLRFENLLVC